MSLLWVMAYLALYFAAFTVILKRWGYAHTYLLMLWWSLGWLAYAVFHDDYFGITMNWFLATYSWWMWNQRKPPRKRKLLKVVSDRIKQLINAMSDFVQGGLRARPVGG